MLGPRMEADKKRKIEVEENPWIQIFPEIVDGDGNPTVKKHRKDEEEPSEIDIEMELEMMEQERELAEEAWPEIKMTPEEVD